MASHIANLPGWAAMTIQTEQLDYAPVDGPSYQPAPVSNRKELLAEFEKNVADTRAALSTVSDEEMMKPWTLLAGGQTIFTLPRIACIRGMVFNHLIHHRGQLTMYFRQLDVPVPGLYGPSADEATAPAASASA
jgi:uncharacterized damage-inducible protein DinB